MTVLRNLTTELNAINAHFNIGRFEEPKSIRRTADELEKKFGEGRVPDTELVSRTIESFLRAGTLAGYREIRAACFGLLTPLKGDRTLVANVARLNGLLEHVDAFQAEPKRLKRCFQGLLAAYLSLDGCDAASDMHKQWNALRSRLQKWSPALQKLDPRPDWVSGVLEHQGIFGDDPTAKYGKDALTGNNKSFEGACASLSINQNSWVRRRVVLSAIDVAASKTDAAFKAHLEPLLNLLKENTSAHRQGCAALLDRFAKQADTSESVPLRMFAIETFGNPLITGNQQRWTDVSRAARDMVSNWLKGFLIERFFELLSQDETTDRRRPKFWLRHRGSIESMWFVLGASAMRDRNDDFVKLRRTMGNQCLELYGANAGNNAFVMKFKNCYVVEFGESGNAAYVFKGHPPFDLSRRLLHLKALKHDSRSHWLTHHDRGNRWEERFSDALALYGTLPDDGPSRSSARQTATGSTSTANNSIGNLKRDVAKLCNERGLTYDFRAPSGRLVVYAGNRNATVSKQLEQWGFRYHETEKRWVKAP